jgi:hypothetical protein
MHVTAAIRKVATQKSRLQDIEAALRWRTYETGLPVMPVVMMMVVMVMMMVAMARVPEERRPLRPRRGKEAPHGDQGNKHEQFIHDLWRIGRHLFFTGDNVNPRAKCREAARASAKRVSGFSCYSPRFCDC